MKNNTEREFIESCWQEIEKPRKRQPAKPIPTRKQPRKKQPRKTYVQKQDDGKASPFDFALLIFLIVLCVVIVAYGLHQ